MTIPTTMTAAVLTGHGGFECIEIRHDVSVPKPQAGEVLIKVAAAGINNTDINTRIAWYSKSVRGATNDGGDSGFDYVDDKDGSWSGAALTFPRIQGADCCGTVVAVGDNVNKSRIGERVLVRSLMRAHSNYQPFQCWTFGSECDGGFAQFAVAPSADTYSVNSDWSDVDLASIPCAYSTAEGMLQRASAGAERVLITGASGGVGSAAIQLAKCRGATVVALSTPEKADELQTIGADSVIDRNSDLLSTIGENNIDVVVDLVAGDNWQIFPELLVRGGRYVTAGAIGGPIVEMDVRTLYLKDLSFFGCTFQEDSVFESLIGYIERNEIKPLVAKTYALKDIVEAQQEFLKKKHIGKLVLIPPA